MATRTGTSGNDILNGTDNTDTLTGLEGDDQLYGFKGSDTLKGGPGNDLLVGAQGNDSLTGGAGDDILDGGLGADNMAGGLGNDTYEVDNTGDRVTESSASGGLDLVESSISYTLGAYVENLNLLGDAAIDGTGNALDNNIIGNPADNVLKGGGGSDTLYGLEGNDSLTGGIGDDVLFGGDDDDTLTGGDGNDTLNAGNGYDVMTGGAGDDSYFVFEDAGRPDDVVIEAAGGGHDTVQFSSNYAYAFNERTVLADNVEDAVVYASSEQMNLVGNSLDNVMTDQSGQAYLFGGSGNDTLNYGYFMSGDLGNDHLNGGDADESLNGGYGNDVLSGGGGADQLRGDAGADSLTGGAGADWFTVAYTFESQPGAYDTILDFHSSAGAGREDDRLNLQIIDANELVAGNQAFHWVGNTAFSGAAGELRADVTHSPRGTSYHFYGDVDGDGAADFEMVVHLAGTFATTLYTDDIIF